MISWDDFSNYLISKASYSTSSFGGKNTFKKNSMAIGSMDGGTSGQADKIKSYSLATSTHIPPKDKEKHKQQKPIKTDDDGETKNEGGSKKVEVKEGDSK
jgi:hypothetical protein